MSVFLYHTLLQPAGAACGPAGCAAGSFTAAGAAEIVIAAGGGTGGLRLLRLSPETGRLARVPGGECAALGRVRSIAAVRPSGSARDFLVVGSDAGAVTIIEVRGSHSPGARAASAALAGSSGGEADAGTVRFVVLHCEVFGRAGLRRIVPGQFLACDPHGRAVMVAALEKSKVVYILNRGSSAEDDDGTGAGADGQEAPSTTTSAARLTISSPLEAHEAQRAVIDVVALDVGFDNPLFAVLEIVYPENDESEALEADGTVSGEVVSPKRIVFWELDLGLNTMVKRGEIPVALSAHKLIAVPGEGDGPGGLLVCTAGAITYIGDEDRPHVRCELARRRGVPINPEHTESTYGEEGSLIIAVGAHRQRGMFLFLLQNEHGDVFKVTLDVTPDGEVSGIRQSYFETLPLASSLVVLRAGFLFVVAETGSHQLYEFLSLGGDGEVQLRPTEFEPRDEPEYLELTDEVASLAPIIDLKVASGTNDAAALASCRIFAICGRGERTSALKVLRHGLPVTEIADSPLPETASALWTLRHPLSQEVLSALAIPEGKDEPDVIADMFHRHIVVSFEDATLVLAVGDSVQEATETGLLTDTRTILAADIGSGERQQDASAVQVHPAGVRHIRLVDGSKSVSQWQPPAGTKIEHAAANRWQIIIALDNGELILFEVNQATSQLTEVGKLSSRRTVCALAIAPVPGGRRRAKFAAMGDARSNTVRMLSLETSDTSSAPGFAQRVDSGASSGPRPILSTVAVQTLPTAPTSLSLGRLPTNVGSVAAAVSNATGSGGARALHLSIGLDNGVLVRTTVDSVTGELQDARTRFLGGRAVKVCEVDSSAGFVVAATAAAASAALEEAAELEEEDAEDPEIATLRQRAGELTQQLAQRQTPHNSEGDAVVALSSAPWLTYWNGTQQRLQSMPLAYGTLDAVAPLASPLTPAGGCVALAGNLLRVFSFDAAATDAFSVTTIPLKFTPRRLLIHPVTHHAVVLQSEQRQLVEVPSAAGRTGVKEEANDSDDDMDMDMDVDAGTTDQEGEGESGESAEGSAALLRQLALGTAGNWASRVSIVDAEQQRVLDSVTFPQDEAVLCGAFVVFHGKEGEVFLCVGTASKLRFRPKRELGDGGKCFLRTYRLPQGGTVFEELHCTTLGTDIHSVPTAMTSFHGMLLVGVGKSLRLYDLGKRQLLRKCASDDLVPSGIVSVEVAPFPRDADEDEDESPVGVPEESTRVLIGDGRFGTFFVQYDSLQNVFVTFADEVVARNLTTACALDFDTVVGSDKFGNIHTCRLPEAVSREVAEDETGAYIRTQAAVAQAAQSKGLGAHAAVSSTQNLETLNQFHLGETVTAMHVAPMVPGGTDSIVYGTMVGAVGAFQPLTSREDVDFFQHVEMHMRQARTPLLGRDHLQFRSSYFPSKQVIDGQLCEQFALLPADVQHEIADELERTPADILKKLEDVRNRLM
jgi:splicing factor 3B subunit 3